MPSSSCPANPPSPSPPFCSEGRDLLLRNYQRGRKVHWSGFSSATPRREVALQFAGAGGVLLRLDLLPPASRARDTRPFPQIDAVAEARAPPPPSRPRPAPRRQPRASLPRGHGTRRAQRCLDRPVDSVPFCRPAGDGACAPPPTGGMGA